MCGEFVVVMLIVVCLRVLGRSVFGYWCLKFVFFGCLYGLLRLIVGFELYVLLVAGCALWWIV